jgi:hypothetical protein
VKGENAEINSVLRDNFGEWFKAHGTCMLVEITCNVETQQRKENVKNKRVRKRGVISHLRNNFVNSLSKKNIE